MRISGVMMLALGVVAYEEEAAMLQVKGDENAELALQEVARSQPFTGPNGVARRRRPVSPTKPTPTPPTPTPTPSPKVHKRGNKKVTKAYKKVRKARKAYKKVTKAPKAYKKVTKASKKAVPPSPSPSPLPVCPAGQQVVGEHGCRYKCESDLVVPISAPLQKGLALDDTTLHWCPENMPFHWPNTDEPVTSFRMFKAWAPWWKEDWLDKAVAWQHLASHLEATNGKVLVGTQITCIEEDDDEDWENVKAMLNIFGPERVMGLSVGNELELLWTKGSVLKDIDLPICLDRMWNQRYFLNKFHSRVQEMDALGAGFEQLQVTSAFGGFILAGEPPFHDVCDIHGTCALVNTFIKNVTMSYGQRYAHTLNVYPYFEKKDYDEPVEDPPQCDEALTFCRCFESAHPSNCSFTNMVEAVRKRLDMSKNADATLWIGETGWSAPKATTLGGNMSTCDDWSSKESFAKYYTNFLDWDLNMNGKYRGPDHVFYFTMRDSENFGKPESFGLIGDGDSSKWCTNTTCKIQQASFPPPKAYKKAPKAYKKAPKAYKKAPKAPKAPKASRTRTYKKAPKASRTRTYKKVTKARRPRSTRR